MAGDWCAVFPTDTLCMRVESFKTPGTAVSAVYYTGVV